MNIYTLNIEPEQYGFMNIINAIKERNNGAPIKLYTLNDVNPYIIENVIKEGVVKNNPKIEKYVNGINELIAQAVDSDGDKLGVIDPTSTWEEPFTYDPIIYQNGALKITSYSPYTNKGNANVDIIRSKDMEYDGIPTLQLLSRMYKKAIKNYAKNREAEEKEESLRNNRNGVFGSIH